MCPSEGAPSPEGPSPEESERLLARRESLKAIGRFAAATAPAMLILLQSGSAAAKEGGGSTYNPRTRRHSHG